MAGGVGAAEADAHRFEMGLRFEEGEGQLGKKRVEVEIGIWFGLYNDRWVPDYDDDGDDDDDDADLRL
jgi:hypothetical protein